MFQSICWLKPTVWQSWLFPLCSGSTLLRRAFRGGYESGGTLSVGTGLGFGSVWGLASTLVDAHGDYGRACGAAVAAVSQCLAHCAACSTAPWCMPSGTTSSTRRPRWLTLFVLLLLLGLLRQLCLRCRCEERGFATIDFEGVDLSPCPRTARRTY